MEENLSEAEASKSDIEVGDNHESDCKIDMTLE
jgi:hypothetical protein